MVGILGLLSLVVTMCLRNEINVDGLCVLVSIRMLWMLDKPDSKLMSLVSELEMI